MKYLVNLWEANISRLESQQSRKVWTEIASKVNEHFNLARLPSQCERKIKHLKKKYKEAKEWNRSQTGGNNETCEHFDVLDRVLGGRNVVTLKHVRETANTAEKNKEKLPDLPAGDEEEDQAEEALQAMGIKVKSRSERKKGKAKGKGRKRSLENDDSEDFTRFTERVKRQGDRLANVVEQMQEMQREQTQAKTGFLAALTKAIAKN